MKKLIFAIALAIMAACSFGQGTILFKTAGSKNPVYYTTDQSENPAMLALVGTDGTAGSFFGTVNYIILSAPNGTAPLTDQQLANVLYGFTLPAGWSETVVPPSAYTSPGVVSPGVTITLPASSGSPGSPVEMAILAYAGSSLFNADLYGWSGKTFDGGNTVTYNGQTTSTGALSWSQATGNPNALPVPDVPATLTNGAAGFGSIVLVNPIPEPSTIVIGGLGAAALLFFRRRKYSWQDDPSRFRDIDHGQILR